MESMASSIEGVHQSPPLRRRRRFNMRSKQSNLSLINNKEDEAIIKGSASIIFHKDGLWFHGIIKGDQGGHYQILGELDDSESSTPEIFSSSYEGQTLGSSSKASPINIMKANPRSRSQTVAYTTRLFENHFEALELGSLQVLCNKEECYISSSDFKVNFSSSQAYRGVKADKVITSLLGPSFVEQGLLCYTGSIVLTSPLPPMLPLLNGSSNVVECFL